MSRCHKALAVLRTWPAIQSPGLILALVLMLSPAAVPMGGLAVSAATPVVNAGPDKVLAFPAKDLTLFGHAVDPENEPLTVQWTLTSGPAPVTFSASGALTTTVTFTAIGTYIFQLAGTDGTSTTANTVQITVNPASSQTAFYVDPTFTGVGNGTAQAPWRWFEDGNPHQTAQWDAINRALASNDVIIYFSARQAVSDAAEQITGAVRVMRTDNSTHRLTLDGMSKYNANDASPSWTDYAGQHRMRLQMTRGCCFSIGWDNDVQQDYITMRGFEVTGSGARIRWGGSYSVLEYIWSHDVTTLGATVQFNAAVSDYPVCKDFGKAHDITVRNNLIERTIGEAIYMAGTYLLTEDGGCPFYGNTHSDILIEGNTIRHAGYYGEQGDGIDLKAGLMNVTVRNNVIQNMQSPDEGGDGIVSLGVFTPVPTNYLFEGNRISGGMGSGMTLLAQSSSVIRNNLIYRNAGSGISLTDAAAFINTAVRIYNNTIYGNAVGVRIGAANGVTLRNNLVFNNGSGGDSWGSSNISSDYNLFAPGPAGFPEGVHSIVIPQTSGITVDPAQGDFRLAPQSPAIDKGADLSTVGFASTFDGLFRPQGIAWDIGAYELGPGQSALPKNLRVMGGNH
jgi:parallel beta-helix repeat protein